MNISKLALALSVIGLLLTVAGAVGTVENKRRAFMIECQSDGLKHYQCVSLWNGAGLPVFRSRDMIPLN